MNYVPYQVARRTSTPIIAFLLYQSLMRPPVNFSLSLFGILGVCSLLTPYLRFHYCRRSSPKTLRMTFYLPLRDINQLPIFFCQYTCVCIFFLTFFNIPNCPAARSDRIQIGITHWNSNILQNSREEKNSIDKSPVNRKSFSLFSYILQV